MAGEAGAARLPEIRVPAGWTFLGLAAGLACGIVLQGSIAQGQVLAVTGPLGELWLKALKVTILPLVSALIFGGVLHAVATASASTMARRTLALFVAVLLAGGLLAIALTSALLALFPAPAAAIAALSGNVAEQPVKVPALADFLGSLIPGNVFEAAAGGAVLPVILFMTMFALATARLPREPRERLAGFFEAIAGAMMVIIGWVLKLAPLGVFALALGVAAQSGATLIAVLAHYIAIVAASGAMVLLAAYPLALLAGRRNGSTFAKAMLPVQAVALSTQSSLAGLPTMLAACRKLDVRETNAEFVLPLAVALFRATSPAMNLAVVIYVAHLTGTPLTPMGLAAGLVVSMLAMLGSPSLPGTISFVTSTGPIALAMGVPIEPLALLVAVEMLPDVVRTVGNVTMDVAVTVVVDQSSSEGGGGPSS